jgi:hypothetical protein
MWLLYLSLDGEDLVFCVVRLTEGLLIDSHRFEDRTALFSKRQEVSFRNQFIFRSHIHLSEGCSNTSCSRMEHRGSGLDVQGIAIRFLVQKKLFSSPKRAYRL